MKKYFLILFLLIPAALFSQVVNIEDERIKTDSAGWAGDAKISFQLMQSKDRLMDVGSQLHLQYKTKRSLYLMLSDYNLIKAGEEDYANSGFQHLRYNYKIKDGYAWEAFGQVQFNKILSLKFRGLLGTGPRFKMIKAKNFRLYAAWLYMFEYEELETTAEINRNHRISSYISFSWKINDILKLVNTTYYQPLINDFSDFRISAQTDFEIKISKRFLLSVGYKHYYDTNPPDGVVNTIYSLENNIVFGF